MIRKLFHRILLLVSIIPLLTACEGLDGCMVCQLNTYENGLLIIEGAETEYCAERLIAIQAIADEVDPPYTYKYECR
jgi:hypothetical protein